MIHVFCGIALGITLFLFALSVEAAHAECFHIYGMLALGGFAASVYYNRTILSPRRTPGRDVA